MNNYKIRKANTEFVPVSNSEPTLEPAEIGRVRRQPLALTAVLVLSLAFATVAWFSQFSLDTHWDESCDLGIANSLLVDPIRGSPGDPSQARLPMYVTALALGVARPASYESSLFLCRSLSIAAGAATIFLTFILARQWFGTSTGLLSATILASSPYFLGFSRMALTEGDAFCPATVLLVLLAFDRYRSQHSPPSVILLGLAMGIALASKFMLICLFAPLVLCDLSTGFIPAASSANRSERTKKIDTPWHLVAWSTAALFLLALAVVVVPLSEIHPAVRHSPAAKQWAFLAAAAFWATALSIGLVLIHDSLRHYGEHRLILPADGCYPAWAGWLSIILLSGVFCLALFPEHVFNYHILRAFLGRIWRWDGKRPWSELASSARLHGGVILFKLGLPLGVLSVSAFVWYALRSAREFVPRVFIGVTVVHTAMLLTLPVFQTFYLMSVHPIIVIALSDFIIRARRTLPRGTARSTWSAIVTGAIGWMLLGDIRAYPAFGYFGYETLGARCLGSENRGYRNIVQVTNDGTEEALRWCNEHVPAGRKILLCTDDHNIAQDFINRTRPGYKLVLCSDAGCSYDYVVSHHVRTLNYYETPPEPSDAGSLHMVHTVYRGNRLYRLPVVTVYQR